MARPRTPRPSHVRVRMYQVGFGDCFLVSFHYRRTLADGRAERHILFDFGSTRAPGRRRLLPGVAQLLEQHTNGRLDVLVATHRHKDHIDGFGLPVTAAVIDRLEPDSSCGPGLTTRSSPTTPARPRPARLASVRCGARGGTGVRRSRRLAVGCDRQRALRGELAALASDQLPNRTAIANLEQLGEEREGSTSQRAATRRSRSSSPGSPCASSGRRPSSRCRS